MVLNCQDYMNWDKDKSYDNLMDLVAEYKTSFNTNIKTITGYETGYTGNNVKIVFNDETKMKMWEFKHNRGEDSQFQIDVDYHGSNDDFIKLVNLINKYVNIN